MPKYVAFLRAINVGGHVVKMDRLRRLFEDLKFANVETFIASGNVVFDSTAKSTQTLEKKIETHLGKELGYPVATFIRSTTELADVARYKPFAEAELDSDDNTLYIGFVADSPGAEAKRKLSTFVNQVDDLHIHRREVYWLRRRQLGESEFSGALLEKILGMPATVRNSTTVKKIVAKYA